VEYGAMAKHLKDEPGAKSKLQKSIYLMCRVAFFPPHILLEWEKGNECIVVIEA
jgi:hypothetical protein